ncbi:LysE family translocator [Agromyces sp. SYSU K20354]|uniref:LysE family translocator n=1 Tax=Agromyces cavernae TaxID=2898659 RepID=UPI001E28AFDC|nr:LysE family translocator [Agromyces cavernae]MCD2443107.1 LysE family translocator [Agromyces cavernae]
MNTELLLACWGMMTLMVLVPGPDWAYIIDAGMRDRTIVPSLGGILVGYLAAVAAVAVGVGAAVAALPWVLIGLTFAAAGYLSYLGIRVLTHPPSLVAADATGLRDTAESAAAPGTRPWRRLAQGAGVSGLNPKGLLVLVVLLPQFTDAASAWPIPVQLAVLGLIFVASCALVYSVVGVGARTVLRVRPSAVRTISRISGAAMIVLAVVLVVEQVSHLAGG